MILSTRRRSCSWSSAFLRIPLLALTRKQRTRGAIAGVDDSGKYILYVFAAVVGVFGLLTLYQYLGT